jgi:hypothetical protein
MSQTSGSTNGAKPPLDNRTIASHLDAVAELLEAQAANQFRVQAYRAAAETLRTLDRPASEILEQEGIEGLRRLPTIGRSLSRSIEQLVETGRLNLLERLQGETSPERVLATVAGIGPELANRIHQQLGIETLLELEAATYDGRLATVPGFGAKRIRGVRESLAGRFRRRPQTPERPRTPPDDEPPVSELLDIDAEYRRKARQLPHIAPRRFNPTREAWLPVLHTQRGDRHYTALYSNTARAHELNMIHDWIVIYRDDPEGDGQWTVVTARYGALKGRRIVRGREAECQEYYQHEALQAEAQSTV